MDQSLRNAIPGVLTRPPSERGVFDGTVRREQRSAVGDGGLS